ncbi:SIS domain-containing protein [candidate division KSB1 bacterium]|nr:SIS domain-containing protein [candidate division KSB1 bacterium]
MNTEQYPSIEYLMIIKQYIEKIQTSQIPSIQQAAKICARSISSNGLVHLFASGHSRALVEEMFPRYGSFPGFNPLVELSLTFHSQVVGSNGQAQAMYLENVQELGKIILENANIAPNDSVIVISNSGITPVVVEFALGAKLLDIPVIVVTSSEQCNAMQAKHSTGRKLVDVADILIDTCTPPGDALISIDGIDDKIGPGSTVTGAVIINALKCEIAKELVRLGVTPPVFVNAYFGEERSKKAKKACWDEFRFRLSRSAST